MREVDPEKEKRISSLRFDFRHSPCPAASTSILLPSFFPVPPFQCAATLRLGKDRPTPSLKESTSPPPFLLFHLHAKLSHYPISPPPVRRLGRTNA